MNRISENTLAAALNSLNDALGLCREPYAAERNAAGNLESNAGTYVLDWAYGGVRLSQMAAGGGERDISGRGTKRECYTYICAMLAGIDVAKKSEGAKA
jgi:hypothetical protein